MTDSQLLSLTVEKVQHPHPHLCHLVLRAADDGVLPGFDPGAHIKVQVHLGDGISSWRHYSLVNTDTREAARTAPTHYELGIRLESEGRGGSRFMHSLRPGDRLLAEPPRTDFPLDPQAGPVVLVGGGIGVTPLTSMAAECLRLGHPVRMLYAARGRGQFLFLDRLAALLGPSLALHVDDEAGAPLDADALLDACKDTEIVYLCGPSPMLEALRAGAQRRGWPPGRIRFELFGAPASAAGDEPFELVLQQSGRTLQVARGQSILECLEANGCDALSDCRRGECGVCVADVVEGDIDHRDHVLGAADRASGKLIQICVSRARGRLVLDL